MAVPYSAAPAMTPVAIPTDTPRTELDEPESPTAFDCESLVADDADDPVPEPPVSSLPVVEVDPSNGHVRSIMLNNALADASSCWKRAELPL